MEEVAGIAETAAHGAEQTSAATEQQIASLSELTTTTQHLSVAAAKLTRSEEHTSELQSQSNLVCRLLLEKKKRHNNNRHTHYRHPEPPVAQHWPASTH